MAGMATLARASVACGVSVSGLNSRNCALVGSGRTAKQVAITCAATGPRSSVESNDAQFKYVESKPAQSEPVQRKADGKLNAAEELLEEWAKQPKVPSDGPSSVTEAVRRLFLWDDLPKKEEVQVFSVYEINEHDRDSPGFLGFSKLNISRFGTSKRAGTAGALNKIWTTLSSGRQHALGDMVPFTNKIYDSSLRMRLGVTAGLTIVVKSFPGRGQSNQKKQKLFFPDRYEAMYTFYMGDLGHVSAQGPFSTFQDSLLTVTGGAGMFREAKGVIQLHNMTPFKLFYTFHLRGVPELPSVLTQTPVEPTEFVEPCEEAALCKPGFALPNYTD